MPRIDRWRRSVHPLARTKESRPAAAELRKALKSETDQAVKKAIQEAIDRIDPPVDKLNSQVIYQRLRFRGLDAKTRNELIKALGHERFSYDRMAQATLARLLLDPEVRTEAAAALESLEQHRANKAKEKRSRVNR